MQLEKFSIQRCILNFETNALFLCFDYGTKRIGLAFGNLISKNASSAGIIHYNTRLERFNQLKAIINEYKPNYLVVGLSIHSDGSTHDLSRACINFGLDLNRYFSLPIIWIDERYTTQILNKQYKKYIDDKSAILILEQLLNNSKQAYLVKK